MPLSATNKRGTIVYAYEDNNPRARPPGLRHRRGSQAPPSPRGYRCSRSCFARAGCQSEPPRRRLTHVVCSAGSSSCPVRAKHGSATLAVRALPAPGQTHVNEMERRFAPNQHDGPREAPRLPGALPHGSRQPGPRPAPPNSPWGFELPVGPTPFYLIRAVPTALVDSDSTRTEPCVSTRPDPEPQVRLPRRKATDCN